MSRTHWTDSDNPDRIGANLLMRGILVLAILTVLSWGGYLAYLHFVEGPAITQHGQNIRHSINFIQSANMRAESMIPDYDTAVTSGDMTHANALRNSICSAAGSITPTEQSEAVRSFAIDHCGAH